MLCFISMVGTLSDMLTSMASSYQHIYVWIFIRCSIVCKHILNTFIQYTHTNYYICMPLQ